MKLGGVTNLELVTLGEELLLVGLLGILLPGEVGIVVLLNIDTGEINAGGCGDNVTSVDAAEGNTVDLEGAGNQKDSVGESLQEDDALSAVTSSEDDKDGTRDQAGAVLGGVLGLADLEMIVSTEFRVVDRFGSFNREFWK